MRADGSRPQEAFSERAPAGQLTGTRRPLRLLCVILLVGGLLSASSLALTIHVDVSNSSGLEDGSPAHPYNTIQEAVDSAADGDEVLVQPGVYVETVSFVGSGISESFSLRAAHPGWDVGPLASVIVGDLDADPSTAEGPVITLSGLEGATCLIEGFTIEEGRTWHVGGGICGNGSRSAISRCRITNNAAYYRGGGLYGCLGAIQGCLISGNWASDAGGGLCECNGLVRGNEVSGNTVDGRGGGLAFCDGEVLDNCIRDNAAGDRGGAFCSCEAEVARNVIVANRAVSHGGGLYACGGDVACNVIAGNVAGWGSGGGACSCTGDFISNTICGNCAGGAGGGLYFCSAALSDCIIWGNDAPVARQVAACPPPSYCCIEDWGGGGVGNTADDPAFVSAGHWTGAPGDSEWVIGDWRLLPESPCIDSADGDSAPESDIACRPRFDHPDVANTGCGDPCHADMGACESHLRRCGSPTFAQGWNLISLPLAPVSPEAEAALDDLAQAGNSIRTNLWRYVSGKGYEECGRDFFQVEMGHGYWLRVTIPAEEALLGDCEGCEHAVPLSCGWNLIGHPSVSAVPWGLCRLRLGDQEMSVGQAVAAGWLSGTLFFYEGGYASVPDDDSSLRPWHGYWLLAYLDGLKLIVPGP